MLNHNHILKFISVLVSLLIWFYVVGSTKVEREKVFPIVFELPTGLALETLSDSQVRFRLRGPRFLLDNFLNEEHNIVIPVTPEQSGQQGKLKFNIDNYEHNIPLGIEVLNKDIREIVYSVNQQLRKTVSIKPEFDEQLLNDFEIKSVELSRDEVAILGTQKNLRTIKKISTEKITIKNINKDLLFELKLKSPSRLVNFNSDIVTVKLEVSEKLQQRKLIVPIQYPSELESFKKSDESVEIIVEGSKIDLDRIDKDDISISVNIEEPLDMSRPLKLIVSLPVGPKLISTTPDSIRIEQE